ncbi:hypothetical protein [Plantactinospora sp. WMMB782]|uniref:hypothetical protein n=1 Tax=Plantactinospora sp. WMMB782 TaxID=3404121 RepID=UPI003B93A4B2
MTAAALDTAATGTRPSAALRVARVVARVHLVVATCLAGYTALWVTTLQSSEGQLAATGVSRLDIKLMWFSLAGVVLLAVVGTRLLRRLPGTPTTHRTALAVHALAVLNCGWQSTMVYQHTTLAMLLPPLLIAALLLVRPDADA